MKRHILSLIISSVIFSASAMEAVITPEEEATQMFQDAQDTCREGCTFEMLPLKFQKFLKSKQDLNKDKPTMSMNHIYTISQENVERHPAFVVRMTAVKGSEFRGNYMYTVYTNSQGTINMDSNKDVFLRKTTFESLTAPAKPAIKKTTTVPVATNNENLALGPVSDRPLKPVPPLPPETMKKIQAKIEHNEAFPYHGPANRPPTPQQKAKANSMALVPYQEPAKTAVRPSTPPQKPVIQHPAKTTEPTNTIIKKKIEPGNTLSSSAAVKSHADKHNKAKRPKAAQKITEDNLLLSSLSSANTLLNE